VDGEKGEEESDQLPENAPTGEVSEDDSSEARAEAEKNAGAPDREGQATGNPKNAG